jgi:hypothetical protein
VGTLIYVDKPTKGWHKDPTEPGRSNYWDGRRWNGFRQVRGDGHAGGAFRLYGWRRVWNGKILRNPAVFYPLAWFNCSVPGTKGRLDRSMRPPQARRR